MLSSRKFSAAGRERDGERFSLLYRMSWTLVRSGEQWRIASHHASPKNWA
jgi:ketosteroid isomerase-like protein